MHSERISNLNLSWIAFGWFIAAAVTSLVVLGFVAFGFMSEDTTQSERTWTALALLIGFATGGFFVGVRTRAAPILHGIAIGLLSLVVWFLVNLIPGEATGWTAWRAIPVTSLVALIGLQTAAAVVGARMGLRWRG